MTYTMRYKFYSLSVVIAVAALMTALDSYADISENELMLDRSTLPLEEQAKLSRDSDLSIHYSWLMRDQLDLKTRDDGAAAGHIFRKGLKTWYRNHYGKASAPSDDSGYGMEYDVDASDDELKLRIQLNF